MWSSDGLRVHGWGILLLIIKSKDFTDQHYRAARILKETLVLNAGLYAKFGQIIGSLDVVVPDPYKETFESMFMKCPADSYEVVKREVESTLGRIEDVFREFD
jgi:predicted unusual protein kinase regulating ubiquinone biosynthesis (AarF/ABC1/UbiB family)